MTPEREGGSVSERRLRLALVVSHPIQYFAPLYREVAAAGESELRVFFCSDWGVRAYHDPLYGREVEWDVPLLEGYEHEFLPIRRRPRRTAFFEVDNPAVDERLAAFAPDIVLVHGYGVRTMWRAVRWARRHERLACLSSDSQAGVPVAAWKRPLKALFVGRFYAWLDGALAAGDNNRAYHLAWGLPAERVFPSALPVDGQRLLASVGELAGVRKEVRGELGIPEEAVVALFCGNLTPWKRPGDFVAAVERAAAAGAPVWGLMVGDGPERAQLEKAVAGAGGRVRLAGFVNQSAIGRFYAAADLLAVPSERDAHPLVVTEALFFGLPVVISDAVGCIGAGDTAQPGRNALVFPCGEVSALAAHLTRLAAAGELRTRLGQASREISRVHDAPHAARLLAEATRELTRLGPRNRGGRPSSRGGQR
ncbi:MAG: glycosyltransferase family 4 protein [Acidobacteriota bacterium]|nr:glycosyltransferase family 4 protein [Acidobacteriota bacterium]